jgi:hypothetical protein
VVEDVALDLEAAPVSRSTVKRSRSGLIRALCTVATLSPPRSTAMVSRARSSRFCSRNSSSPAASLMTTVSRTRRTLSSTRKIRSPRSFSIQKSSPKVSSFSRSR